MSKSCCFAVVLAVICLPVILLSLKADAQPTVDETMTCSPSTLEEVVNMVKIIAVNQRGSAQEIMDVKEAITDKIRDEIKDMKVLLASESVESNETCGLEEVVKEIKDVKTLVASGSGQTNATTLDEVVNMVKVIASDQQETAREMRDLKRLLVSGDGNETRLEKIVAEIREEVEDVKRILTSNAKECENVRPQTTDVTVQPSKPALLSALRCECLVCLYTAPQHDND